MDGWIKLHRKLLNWEWYDHPNVIRLYLHILLKTNHREKHWHGIKVKKGEFITSRETLAKELSLSPQMIRSAINRLKSTSEITTRATNRYTIISVNNYDLYQFSNQPDNQQPTTQATNKQPTDNQQITTTKKEKKVKKVKNEKNIKNKTHHQNPTNDFEGVCFDFESVWKTYPRKISKEPSKKKWDKLSLETKKMIVEVLPVHIKHWDLTIDDVKHIPHFSTWINQMRWQDDLTSTSKQPKKQSYQYDSTGKIIGWCSKCKVSLFYNPFNINKTDSTCCSSELLFNKPEAPLKKETVAKVGTDAKEGLNGGESVIYKPSTSKYKMKHQNNMDNGSVMISELIGDYKQKESNER